MVFKSNGLAAKAALRNLIDGLPARTAEGWQVTWGFTKSPQTTWVFLGDVSYDSSEWVTNHGRQEIFAISGCVNLKRRRGGPEETETELARIAGLIENAIGSNPNLGIPAVVSTSFIPKRMGSFPSDDMCESQMDFDVRVTARLR